MPQKFYFTTTASRPFVLEGREYKFVPLGINGGRISGVFDTEDATDIAILDRAVARRIGITEISAAEAERAKKKIANSRPPSLISSQNASPRLSSSPAGALLPGPQLSVAESAGRADGAPRPKEGRPTVHNTEITMPTVVSMVRTEKINPPQPLVSANQRMEIRGKR